MCAAKDRVGELLAAIRLLASPGIEKQQDGVEICEWCYCVTHHMLPNPRAVGRPALYGCFPSGLIVTEFLQRWCHWLLKICVAKRAFQSTPPLVGINIYNEHLSWMLEEWKGIRIELIFICILSSCESMLLGLSGCNLAFFKVSHVEYMPPDTLRGGNACCIELRILVDFDLSFLLFHRHLLIGQFIAKQGRIGMWFRLLRTSFPTLSSSKKFPWPLGVICLSIGVTELILDIRAHRDLDAATQFGGWICFIIGPGVAGK